MSLFNFAYYREHGDRSRGPFNEPPFDVLPHLVDREFLSKQPTWAFVSSPFSFPKFLRDHWPLPKVLKAGESATVTLEAPRGREGDGVVRVMAEAVMPKGAVVTVTLNGQALRRIEHVAKPIEHPYGAGLGEAAQWACFGGASVRAGANDMRVTLERGDGVKVVYVDLVGR